MATGLHMITDIGDVFFWLSAKEVLKRCCVRPSCAATIGAGFHVPM